MSEITHDEYKKALDIVKGYIKQLERMHETAKKDISALPPYFDVKKTDKLYDVNISVRLFNALKTYDLQYNRDLKSRFDTIADLSRLSLSKFLRQSMVGKRTLTELEHICALAGVEISE
jgi:DNA-directed RNA polymerase alpha subunit